MRWRALADELTGRLGATESRFVLSHVAGAAASPLLFRSLDEVDPAFVERARTIAERVEEGEPLQHLLGRWGFRTLDLRVDGRALIPRPETEGVVEHALAALDRCAGTGPQIALDLGVGSGAIACALVAERPDVVVVGVDRSVDALSLAAENRAELGSSGERLRLCAGEWYSPFGAALEQRCALIVANPPYLTESEWAAAPEVVRGWDPYEALVGGPVGTEAYDVIVGGAARFLVPGGSLVLEIGMAQGAAVRAIGERSSAGTIAVLPDLAGRDRTVVMTW